MSYSVIVTIAFFLNNYISDIVIFPLFLAYLISKKIYLHNEKIFLPFLVIFLLALLIPHLYSGASYLDVPQVIHFFIIILTLVFVKDREFNSTNIANVAIIFTIINFVLFLLSFAFQEIREVIFFEAIGVDRFQGIYAEPSIAAMYFIGSILILTSVHKKFRIYVVINAFLIFITFSGTGIVLASALLMFFLINAASFRLRVFYMLFFVVFATASFKVFETEMDLLITTRVNRIVDGNYDGSTVIRFLAPQQLAQKVFEESPILGVGAGGAEKFILQHRDHFTLFYIWDGSFVAKINNSYALVFAYGGISLFLSFIIYLYLMKLQYVSKRNNFIYCFLILFPFFGGHFVSIAYWFYVYFIKHNR